MRSKPTTAGDLMRPLESDPAWCAARALRDRQRKAAEETLRIDEAQLVREIRALGYDVDSVWDLVNNAPHPEVETGRIHGHFPPRP